MNRGLFFTNKTGEKMKKLLIMLASSFALTSIASLLTTEDFEGAPYVYGDGTGDNGTAVLTDETINSVDNTFLKVNSTEKWVFINFSENLSGDSDNLLKVSFDMRSSGASVKVAGSSDGAKSVDAGWLPDVTVNDITADDYTHYDVYMNISGSDYSFDGKTVKNDELGYLVNGTDWSVKEAWNLELNGTDISKIWFGTSVTGTEFHLDNVSVTSIPEPATIGLLGLGAAGLIALRRKFA